MKMNLKDKRMTHQERVLEVVNIRGFIIPSKVVGRTVCGMFMPPHVDRRCRELKDKGLLKGEMVDGLKKWTPTKKFYKLMK